MSPYDFVHLGLLAVGGEIRGRTKLQKTVYFLGVFSGALPNLGYRPHFYGPYSDYVAAAVNRLKSLGFVTESTVSSGAIGALGFEIARHDFKLTAEGTNIAKEKAQKNSDAWKKLEKAAARFKHGGDIDYMRMSVAAKTYFMLDAAGKPATAIELSEAAKRLGWQATLKQIDDSVKFLRELDLVTTAPVKQS